MTMTSSRRPARLLALDGFRLVCALAVAAYHWGVVVRLDGEPPAESVFPGASRIAIYGFLGVQAFFMISGFVICMSGWGRRTTDYLISRARRLYPAFWVCVVLSALVVTMMPVGDGRPSAAEIGLNLTLLPQPLGVPMVDDVYWTLWVELRFYVIFALVVRGGVSHARVAGFCVAWLLAALLVPAGALGGLADLVIMREYAAYFVAGIAMYLMHRFRPTPLLAVILLVCWLMSLHQVGHMVDIARPGFPVPYWPAALIITLCYAFLIAVAIGPLGRAGAPWLGVAGALTYPFYLLHNRIGKSLLITGHDHSSLPVPVLLLATAGIVLTAAWLVHRYAERPLAPILSRGLRAVISQIRSAPPERVAA